MSIEKEYCDFCGGLTVDDTVPEVCNGECLVAAEMDSFEELDFSNDPVTEYCADDLLQYQNDFAEAAAEYYAEDLSFNDDDDYELYGED